MAFDTFKDALRAAAPNFSIKDIFQRNDPDSPFNRPEAHLPELRDTHDNDPTVAEPNSENITNNSSSSDDKKEKLRKQWAEKTEKFRQQRILDFSLGMNKGGAYDNEELRKAVRDSFFNSTEGLTKKGLQDAAEMRDKIIQEKFDEATAGLNTARQEHTSAVEKFKNELKSASNSMLEDFGDNASNVITQFKQLSKEAQEKGLTDEEVNKRREKIIKDNYTNKTKYADDTDFAKWGESINTVAEKVNTEHEKLTSAAKQKLEAEKALAKWDPLQKKITERKKLNDKIENDNSLNPEVRERHMRRDINYSYMNKSAEEMREIAGLNRSNRNGGKLFKAGKFAAGVAVAAGLLGLGSVGTARMMMAGGAQPNSNLYNPYQASY